MAEFILGIKDVKDSTRSKKMTSITFGSLTKQGILQKLVAAVMLMVTIPLLLVIYLLYTEAVPLLQKASVQWIIFMMLCTASCGYILSRRIIISIIKVTKEAQSISQGNLKERIKTPEKNEINELAQYFNQITNELEKNIK